MPMDMTENFKDVLSSWVFIKSNRSFKRKFLLENRVSVYCGWALIYNWLNSKLILTLQEALDNLVAKLDAAKNRWTAEATHIHGVQKEKLLEFGLNPLDI